jgi:hypothetical protein
MNMFQGLWDKVKDLMGVSAPDQNIYISSIPDKLGLPIPPLTPPSPPLLPSPPLTIKYPVFTPKIRPPRKHEKIHTVDCACSVCTSPSDIFFSIDPYYLQAVKANLDYVLEALSTQKQIHEAIRDDHIKKEKICPLCLGRKPLSPDPSCCPKCLGISKKLPSYFDSPFESNLELREKAEKVKLLQKYISDLATNPQGHICQVTAGNQAPLGFTARVFHTDTDECGLFALLKDESDTSLPLVKVIARNLEILDLEPLPDWLPVVLNYNPPPPLVGTKGYCSLSGRSTLYKLVRKGKKNHRLQSPNGTDTFKVPASDCHLF